MSHAHLRRGETRFDDVSWPHESASLSVANGTYREEAADVAKYGHVENIIYILCPLDSLPWRFDAVAYILTNHLQ